MDLLRTKSVEQSLRDSEESEHSLRRELGALQLTLIGIGVIVGTGIFVLTGEAAGTISGPAITISFAVAAIVFALAGAGRERPAPSHDAPDCGRAFLAKLPGNERLWPPKRLGGA